MIGGRHVFEWCIGFVLLVFGSAFVYWLLASGAIVAFNMVFMALIAVVFLGAVVIGLPWVLGTIFLEGFLKKVRNYGKAKRTKRKM